MTRPTFLTRRRLLSGATGLVAATCLPAAADVVLGLEDMRPGEFTWHPERAPAGGVAVVVSLVEQRVHVYRNGIRIAVSTCSTGKPGHETPTGVFTILQKDRNHKSSTYSDAPMPNMNRLTWDGVALHAGNLPGYPASHGCVRLPMAFSEKLFSVTHLGTPVIIAGSHSDPWSLQHPGLLLDGSGESRMESAVSALESRKHPADWPDSLSQPVGTILASAADGRAYLFVDGVEVGSAPVTVTGNAPLGEHVLMLETTGAGLKWVGITHHPDPAGMAAFEGEIIDRVRVGTGFNAQVLKVMHPGMTMIITDLPSHPDSRSGTDFVVMTS